MCVYIYMYMYIHIYICRLYTICQSQWLRIMGYFPSLVGEFEYSGLFFEELAFRQSYSVPLPHRKMNFRLVASDRRKPMKNIL